jgi:hypothetical protein
VHRSTNFPRRNAVCSLFTHAAPEYLSRHGTANFFPARFPFRLFFPPAFHQRRRTAEGCPLLAPEQTHRRKTVPDPEKEKRSGIALDAKNRKLNYTKH